MYSRIKQPSTAAFLMKISGLDATEIDLFVTRNASILILKTDRNTQQIRRKYVRDTMA